MRVRRVPVDDRLVDGADASAGALLLVGERLSLVSELGDAILEASGDWIGVDALSAVLGARFGTPPGDPLEETATRCRELSETGLLWLQESGW